MSATPSRLILLSAAAAMALLSTSCGRKDRVEVLKSRAPFADEGEPKLGLSVGQRYAANEAQSILRWTTPEGWNFLPATEFRHLNFDFGPGREGEAYLTLLPMQSGGGVLENLNRWRKQMGQEPLTEAALAALPTKPVFGRPAPFMDISGTFSGGSGPMMAPAAPKPGYRMLGVIFEAPGILFTLKMTGPEALVAANAAKFDAFAQSIGLAGTPAAGL
ncbi:MAG: hypothetical protein JWL81_2254 [Verrucomicrobiales bacterium]|nr:hypothetical protein [Verrucomicrobiales bacterium]